MADPGSIDTGVGFVRDEVMPMIQALDGFVGLSMLVDRSTGRTITTTAWRDEAAMRASDEQLRASRQRAAEMMGAGSPQVEEWEITVLHRAHTSEPGACVRVTWVRTDPQQLDRAIDYWKSTVLPVTEQFDGFCSASMMVQRDSGRTVSSVTFDSREAMDRTREQGEALREQAMQTMGVEILEVAEFDLALAHLRVPEMA
jgi:heme-degrading monooxygenase HmoA